MPLSRRLRLPAILLCLVATLLVAWGLLYGLNYAVFVSYNHKADLWVEGERIPSAMITGDSMTNPFVLKPAAVLEALQLPTDSTISTTKPPAIELLTQIRRTHPGAYFAWRYDGFRPEPEQRAWYLELEPPAPLSNAIAQGISDRGGKLICQVGPEQPIYLRNGHPVTIAIWSDSTGTLREVAVVEFDWGRNWTWRTETVSLSLNRIKSECEV